MMRSVVCWVMILSFFALGALDCHAEEWKTGIVALLLGVVQAIIFI